MEIKNAMTKIKKLIGNRIKIYYQDNPVLLGGPNVVVHVDETMFNHKVKSHSGRASANQVWCHIIDVTGFVPVKGYCKIISNKTCEVIIPIINSVVRAGLFIYTDEMHSYLSLERNQNYEYAFETHKYYFLIRIPASTHKMWRVIITS
jgi:hypothetical protein